MSWLRDRKLALAKKARKSDTNYMHAQLLLAGQKVDRDEIVGRSHFYYFDCGCVRSYSLSVESRPSESVAACKRHGHLVKRLKNWFGLQLKLFRLGDAVS
jgi:hypothetical protein